MKQTTPKHLSASMVAPFTDDEITVLWSTVADPAGLDGEATGFIEFVAEDVTDRLLDWLMDADADAVAYHCRVDGRAIPDDDQFVVGCDPAGRWWLSCVMVVDEDDDLLPAGLWDVVAHEPCDVVTVSQVAL